MKTKSFYALLLCTILLPGILLAQELHTESNAGNYLNETNATTGWTPANGGTLVTSSSSEAYSGSYSIKIEATIDGWRRATYSFAMEVGKDYEIKIYAKSASGTGPGFFMWDGFSNFNGVSINSTNWTEYTFNLTANTTTATLKVYSGNSSLIGDAVYIDNISIKPVDTQSPTAPTLSSTGQTDTTVDLSWTGATDDTAVTGYKVFKDGVLEATLGNVSTYQVTGLTVQTAYSFTVLALDAAGNESVASNAIPATTTGNSSSFSLRINAGGPEITHDGEVFLADQYVTGGSTYTNSSALLPTMYQTEHSGTAKEFSYDIPVINGEYTVDLHFAELYWGATGGGTGGTGKRIFDVSVEGTLVMDDYDITADVGSETPVIKTFNATVSDGVLNIDFSSLSAVGGVDQAKVSAIEISGIPVGGGTTSPWVQSGSDINYTAGNVGIGTTAPGAYMLAVNGNIHTKEVKVDLTGWADYVFKKDYSLPTLEAVEKHITEKGHLMNIPSAKEVETNGIQLGEMNKLLLEKIEELTLYILEQEERILDLEKTNEKN